MGEDSSKVVGRRELSPYRQTANWGSIVMHRLSDGGAERPDKTAALHNEWECAWEVNCRGVSEWEFSVCSYSTCLLTLKETFHYNQWHTRCVHQKENAITAVKVRWSKRRGSLWGIFGLCHVQIHLSVNGAPFQEAILWGRITKKRGRPCTLLPSVFLSWADTSKRNVFQNNWKSSRSC